MSKQGFWTSSIVSLFSTDLNTDCYHFVSLAEQFWKRFQIYQTFVCAEPLQDDF